MRGYSVHQWYVEYVGRGEFAAPRRLEHLEHRMAVVEISERAAAAFSAIDDAAETAGHQVEVVLRPAGAVAGDDEQSAAAFDEPLQGAAAGRRRVHRVV